MFQTTNQSHVFAPHRTKWKKQVYPSEKNPENSMVHHPSRGHGEPPFLPFKNDRPNFLDLLAAPILIRLFFYPL